MTGDAGPAVELVHGVKGVRHAVVAGDDRLRVLADFSSGRIIAGEYFDDHDIRRGNRIDGDNFDPLDTGVVLDDVMLIGREDRCIVDLCHHDTTVDNCGLGDDNRRGPEPFDGTAVMAVIGRDNLADDEYMVEVGIQPINEIGGILPPGDSCN